MKKTKMRDFFFRVFGDRTEYLLALIYFRLCHPSAMMYAKTWYQGSYARLISKDIDLSSQRISDFLKAIGDEHLQREYFKNHISVLAKTNEGIIIDATSMPNQIHFPFNTWGYDDGGIDKQIRLLFVIDKKSSLPLYFRYLPGNIVDVSSLTTTIEELKKYNINSSFALVDAGFYSEYNIKELNSKEIDFLTRLPSSTKLYKDLIKDAMPDIETFKNAVKYGDRILFVKRKKVTLFGKDGYAHIVLDPERKGIETKKLLIDAIEDKEADKEQVEFELLKRGAMILVSSFKIEKQEVVPFYYMRQTVEKLIGFAKDDLDLIPLRVHREETLRGYLLLIFITLTIFALMKKEIGNDYTVEEVLLTMRNLKCKVFEDELIVSSSN